MRPESVRTVRIRSENMRNNSGSVSPPAPGDSSNGKAKFFERMRAMYANQGNLEEVENKIEQLWNGLTPSRRELLLRKNGETPQKENKISTPIKKTSPISPSKPKVPVLERRNNMKAIAKVLDLKSAKTEGVPYSEMLKSRMKAYAKEASFIAGGSQSSSSSVSSPRMYQPPETSLLRSILEDHKSHSSISKPSAISSTPKNDSAIFKVPALVRPNPMRSSKGATTTPAPKTVTRKFIVRKTVVPAAAKPPATVQKVPEIPYNVAVKKYYEILSKSYLMDSGKSSNIQIYADIVEGNRPIREYTFGDLL